MTAADRGRWPSWPDAGEVTVGTVNDRLTSNDLSVTVTGDNSDDLRQAAEQVETELTTIPGLTDVTSDLADQRTLLRSRSTSTKAAELGFTQAEVGQAVANALQRYQGRHRRAVRASSATSWSGTPGAGRAEPEARSPPSSCRSASCSSSRPRQADGPAGQAAGRAEGRAATSRRPRPDEATATSRRSCATSGAELRTAEADLASSCATRGEQLGPAQATARRRAPTLGEGQSAARAATGRRRSPTDPPASSDPALAQQAVAAAGQQVAAAERRRRPGQGGGQAAGVRHRPARRAASTSSTSSRQARPTSRAEADDQKALTDEQRSSPTSRRTSPRNRRTSPTSAAKPIRVSDVANVKPGAGPDAP